MKIVAISLICFFFSTPLLANEEALTSSDLLIAQQWLSKNGGAQWKLLYNETEGKKYQWVITKKIFGDDIQVSFTAGREINESGKIIGGVIKWSDQFFVLVIDRKTYKLKNVLLGG